MDGRFSSCDRPNCDPEDAGIAPPETNAPGSPCPGSAGDLKPTHLSSASPKRSRRSVQKRVVTVPFVDGDGSRPKGGGEGAPPSDSWAWRKYGQKPIKGSPYPRGYYRCSSSKGCPARKQVERSRVDPTMLVVTYASEHNHPWPRHKSHHQISSPSASNSRPSPTPSLEEDPAAPVHFSPPDLAEPDDMFSDLIGEESALMRPDDYHWFSDVGSPSSASPPAAADDFLLGPIVSSADVAMPFPEDCDALGAGEEEEEEDSLFAGLGELPECSVVFRRGSFERQMLMRGEESRPCGLAASR